MKKLLALLALAPSLHAEELPKYFSHQYTETVDIILLADQCNKADLSQGWQAYATDKGQRADGCWVYAKDGETVLIYLEISKGKYLDYQIYKDKFKARY